MKPPARSLSLVLAISAATHWAAAAPTKKEQADAAFAEGGRAIEAKEWKKARDKFTESYMLVPTPSSLFNLALAEEESGAVLEAMHHLRAFLGLPDSPVVARNRREATNRLAGCQAKVCRLDVRAPASTSVRVNGKEATLQGSIVETLPGEQQVDLLHDGTSKSRRSACAAGETVVVEFNDPPTTVVIPAPTSTASTSAVVTPPPPPRTEAVRPAAGYIVPAVVVGVGAAGLVLGGVFAASSNSAKSEAEALARPGACANPADASCTGTRDRLAAQSRDHTLSIASFVTGGVLVVGGVVTFLVWPKVFRDVRVAPTGSSLTFFGTF